MRNDEQATQMKDFLAVGLFFLGMMGLLWFVSYETDKSRWERERSQPPELVYRQARVEVLELSRCLTEHTGADGLAKLQAAGVSSLEVVRHDPVYQECSSLSAHYPCGWTYKASSQMNGAQGQILSRYQADRPRWDDWFGVRLSVEDESLRAFLPAAMINPNADMADVCRRYQEQIVGGALNALLWSNVKSAD